MITETSLYEYHRQEWEAFAKEQYDLRVEYGIWDEDETPEFDDFYISELAENYWNNFNELEDTERVWQNVEYSAGVYLGDIDSNNITNRVILHDETFYNGEGEEYKPEVDMYEVTLMNTDPDLYGDECEKFVHQVIWELVEKKMLQLMVDCTGKESLGGYITSEMITRRPELVEVLLEWNQDQTFDEVTEFMNECNNETIQSFMESKGIDW